MKTNLELRKAIGSHHTALSDKAWDGPKAKANLKNDENAVYYRKTFAWVDPDGDPDVKASYKFIHHEVSSDGTIGAANIRGCQASIAVLNGARGGTTIPDSDRKGVYNHVATHLRDGDIEPAELKSMDDDYIEIRTFKAEIRKEGEEKPKIKGTAAVFDQLSDDLCGFKEIIRKGAFSEAMKSDEIYGLKNHNEDLVLGRTKSKTLSLSEDDIGLGFVIDPPDTTYANDLLVSMERGDMDKCSFAFVVDDESVKWYKKDGVLIRDISKMAELWDVSIVTYPAFPQTQAYLFNKRIRTPQQVYKEYRSKLSILKPELKQERLTLARNKLKIYEKL